MDRNKNMQGENSGNLDLSKLAASEYLLLTSDPYDLKLRGSPDSASLAMVPKREWLPGADVSAKLGQQGEKTGALSVGGKNLRYSREATKLPQREGTVVRDTVEGGIGPFRGFYQETSHPGEDLRARRFGGSARVGPATLYGERRGTTETVVPSEYRQYFTNPDVEERETVFGARGSLPMGQGTLSGDISRRLMALKFPQSRFEEARPTARGPNVTDFALKWTGKNFGVGGTLGKVRNVGTRKGVEASLNLPDPFGLGGRLSAHGTWSNPVGGPSTTAGRLNYKLKF